MKNSISCICLVALLSGCATYNNKFKAGTVADIGFFSDSTVTMLSNLDLQLGRNEALLTRRYFMLNEPEEQLVVALDQRFQSTIQGLVEYSIKIVSIAESGRTEEEMIVAYADYLDLFRDRLRQEKLIDAETFDHSLTLVRGQDKFLDALREAQPLLNAVAMDSILNIDELIDAINALVDKVELRIDEEYEDIVRYRQILEDEKSEILTAFELIYAAYKTDEPELSQLRESGVIWMPELIPEGTPTRVDLSKLGEHLEKRLDAMHRISEEVAPDWNDYLSTQKELKNIAKRSTSMVQQTQVMMLTWVRAHQKMAAGKTDPADWFDIGESTKALLKSAPGAVL